jgi:hypothetical protein
MNNKLILRTENSPYGDVTKGSVLSQSDLDNNQIFLKGEIIYTAETGVGIITLKKYNGNDITFSAGSVSTDTYVTGATLSTGYTLTLTRNDGVEITTNLAGLASDVYVLSGSYNTNTGDVTFTNTTGGTFTVTGFVTGMTETYTNTGATPTTIGGIAAGSTFSGKTMQEMWDSLLYPYQVPAFSSFSLGISSPREVGYDITTSQTFTWGTTNASNVSANTITIAGYNLTTLTGLANDGSEAVTFTGVVTRTSGDGPGTRAWTIQGTNTNSATFSGSLSIRWDYRMYAGTSTNTSLTASEITGLTNFTSVKNGFAGTYNMSAGGYKYFCFATGYGAPTSWVDTSNNLSVGMYTGYPNIDGSGNSYDLVSVTNAEGETTNYKVYRTLNILGSTINIALS